MAEALGPNPSYCTFDPCRQHLGQRRRIRELPIRSTYRNRGQNLVIQRCWRSAALATRAVLELTPSLFEVGQEMVGPVDGGFEGLLAGQGGAGGTGKSWKRSSRAPAISAGVNTRTRAAANSMAKGIPSRRRQISPTAEALASERAKPGRARPARSTKSCTASLADTPPTAAVVSSSGTARGHPPGDLARQVERLAAGGQKMQRRTGGHQGVGQLGRRPENMLTVVQHHQGVFSVRKATIGHRRQVDQPYPVGVALEQLGRQLGPVFALNPAPTGAQRVVSPIRCARPQLRTKSWPKSFPASGPESGESSASRGGDGSRRASSWEGTRGAALNG